MRSFVLLSVAGILLLQSALTLASYADENRNNNNNNADNNDDPAEDVLKTRYARGRRGWSMMRLGRGLQMLRLGKRAASASASAFPSPLLPLPHSSPEKMRELLAALLEERKKQFRRQPPMPRYGRQLVAEEEQEEEKEREEAAEELLHDLLGERVGPSLARRHVIPYVVGRRFQRSADVTASRREGGGSLWGHHHADHSFSSGSSS
ncbi:uncharacterized protein LOC143301402 [Babylonia areolata]|uniref:uncharacterized protein LOC143301402 n=1 Tax=Babylonia areolata TaxID=304850 RepID=UPI003FD3CD96